MSLYCQCAECEKRFDEPIMDAYDRPICPFCSSEAVIYDADALDQELEEESDYE